MTLRADLLHLVLLDLPAGLGREGLEVLRAHGQGGLKFPAQTFGHVVGADDFARTRHVTGRAAGRAVVNAGGPGARGRVPAVFVLVGLGDGAVLGLGVDFDLRVVRAQVALAAGLGLAGLGHGEAVSGVAGRAAAQGAVHIHATHTHVGPGGGVELAVLVLLEDGAVAVVAAGGALPVAVHALVEPGVELPHDLDGVGVLALRILLDLVGMAAGAVLGRDGRGHGHAVLLLAPLVVGALVLLVVGVGHVGVMLLGLVAVQAGDVGAGVAAVCPVGEDARRLDLVAFDAGLGLFGHAPLDAELLDFGHVRPGQGADAQDQ